jgi:membrane protease YdiL (CAAX protease family)
MALAGMLIIAALPMMGYRRSGLTLSQNSGFKPALLALLVLSAICFYFAISGADGRDDWETIAFQWTMPGLDEEVFYRGVLLLAMNEAFRGRVSVLGAQIGFGGLLTSVLFGLAHGLSFEEDAFAFNANMFLVTGIPSLLLLWMRERTDSVLLPIIAHNIANGASTLF